MKILVPVILLLIAHFQYRLWLGDGSLKETRAYQQRLAELKRLGEEKRQRNEKLIAEVMDLQNGQEAIEERAREDLGMIRPDETFFQVIE
ncbi:cell division protein FtsB [Methylomicrobium sp. Wu6]|uniref:cell division protein FtsB n=1 Tax=Methylomicrobium sp. Wu6 TaxID=3107928 RepID=UPI002DD61B24|nr:cell division protein FtsB [Methylomicrobium sp. Wu6]MEC4748856.1 cell division protein FtsB [Methylomicrobium sp. Wu6]